MFPSFSMVGIAPPVYFIIDYTIHSVSGQGAPHAEKKRNFSLFFDAALYFVCNFRSDHKAAVDGQNLPGNEFRLCQKQQRGGNLFGGTIAPERCFLGKLP